MDNNQINNNSQINNNQMSSNQIINPEEKEQVPKIKKKIVFEYVSLFVIVYLMPYLILFLRTDSSGIDSIGQALGIIMIFRAIQYILLIIFGFIYPIIVLIDFMKNHSKFTLSKFKKLLCSILILLPILISILIIFSVPISNFFYDRKYNTSSSSYNVDSTSYKSPKDFSNELKKRNLLYDESTSILAERLNGDHNCYNYIYNEEHELESKECYSEATMIGVTKARNFDSNDIKDVTNSDEDYPAYMYNSILTLPGKDEKLQYAALGRFSYNSDDYGDYRAELEDYYIECKIMYVNEDIYAIIGVGSSYGVSHYFSENDPNYYKSGYKNPYYMILSEKPTITTYVDGKYHSDGAIVATSREVEMLLNKEEGVVFSNYPVKQVSRLNKKTIDEEAYKLQQDILKSSIANHFN